MNQNPVQGGEPNDLRKSVNLFMTLIDGIATTLRVLLHYRFGAEQPGLGGLIGAIAIFVFAAASGVNDPRPLLAFLPLYLLMCLFRRLGAARRYFRGDEEHSFFDGYSTLGWLCPCLPERFVLCLAEPLMSLLSAAIIATRSPCLGAYLMLASLCLFISANAKQQVELRRLRRMRDQLIEQRYIGRQFRTKIGVHF